MKSLRGGLYTNYPDTTFWELAMIDYRNPYTPGAGAMPKYLAGRNDILESASLQLKALAANYQSRSLVLYGLRGVGKTVLLNSIESMAEGEGILVRHIEVEEKRGLIAPLASACCALSASLNRIGPVKSKLEQVKNLSTSLTLSVDAGDGPLSSGFNEETLGEVLASSHNLSGDFTYALVVLGKYAQAAGASIFIGIDELQYAGKEELEALSCALHRATQLGLPVMFGCAGLPKLLKMLGEAKTYTERQFSFVKVDSLPRDKAVEAIVRPAQKLDVSYSDEAIDAIIDYTEGYPYFIQELCSTIWTSSDCKLVSLETVLNCTSITDVRLDEDFFSVRSDRCTPRQKEFLVAMVRCGGLPCTLANVAHYMGRDVSSIGPLRAQLISKGMIYSAASGEVDFTVPQFDRYLRRTERID